MVFNYNKIIHIYRDFNMHFNPISLEENIPEEVNHLSYTNKLVRKNIPQIINAFRKIPQNVISLSLSFNRLGEMSSENLVSILKAIPPNVLTLNLYQNNLHLKTIDEQVGILSNIPPNIKSLDLSRNELCFNPFFRSKFSN
jgi:hypothetical protein